jgi:hypothetical protein
MMFWLVDVNLHFRSGIPDGKYRWVARRRLSGKTPARASYMHDDAVAHPSAVKVGKVCTMKKMKGEGRE